MKIAAQVFVYVVSLLTILWLNLLSNFAVTQVHHYTKHFLNGKPLPVLTEFFIGHGWVPVYASFLLWLGLVGAPLLRLSWARGYWEPTAFVLRYLVFFSCEVLLYLFLATALILPFITIMQCMEGGGDTETTAQKVAWWVLWAVAAVVALGAGWRAYQIRRLRP